MKKILSILCMALVSVAMMAQEPVITFERTEHDFGKIPEDGGRVSTEFVFKNEGMAPLVLSNVRASCGCTTPTWTKEPVEPGQTGSITVTYNPNGRPGKFSKTVTITSNATEPGKRVFIKGEVIPKQAKPVNKYTIAVGALNMKSKELNLGDIKKGESKSGELEYANQKAEEHKVALATADSWLINQVTLEAPKPNEVGKLIFAIDTKAAPLYGPVEVYAYVVVDGKLVKTDEYKVTIKANVVEDFSQMSTAERQNAPIIEVPAEMNVGKFAKGKIYKVNVVVKNSGVNPLEVRRAYCEDTRMDAKAPKAIKSGKKGIVSMTIDARELEPASYTREVVIITNDYQNPIKRVKVNFTVE
ncbi:MAG: DUF1573 domain-containing protein [Paludibacteraceae bacterium]|nr:DUF1573 domain-containing protein [Paludibacteraceae bacterium]